MMPQKPCSDIDWEDCRSQQPLDPSGARGISLGPTTSRCSECSDYASATVCLRVSRARPVEWTCYFIHGTFSERHIVKVKVHPITKVFDYVSLIYASEYNTAKCTQIIVLHQSSQISGIFCWNFRMCESATTILSARDRIRSLAKCLARTDFGTIFHNSSITLFNRSRDCFALSLCISRRSAANARLFLDPCASH
jgi:hypothetical protein